MKLSFLFIPFDAYERNKKISSLLKKDESILDVGGGITGIKLFVDNPVTIVDLEVGDIKMDARNLKLKNGSYDTVVSVDVLEHLRAVERKEFIKSLIRIARSRVIVSAPHGGRLHLEAEKALIKYLKQKGKKDFFLQQHVDNILPLPEGLVGGKHLVIYSGDFRVSNLLFKLAHFETGNGILDRLLLVFKRFVNVAFNIFAYPLWFYKKERSHTNRFYLLVDK